MTPQDADERCGHCARTISDREQHMDLVKTLHEFWHDHDRTWASIHEWASVIEARLATADPEGESKGICARCDDDKWICSGCGEKATWSDEGRWLLPCDRCHTKTVKPCPDCGTEREPEGDEKEVNSDAREGIHRGLVGQPDEETEGDVAELKLFCEHGKWLHLECRECGRAPSPSSGEVLSESEFEANVTEATLAGRTVRFQAANRLRAHDHAFRKKLAEANADHEEAEGRVEKWYRRFCLRDQECDEARAENERLRRLLSDVKDYLNSLVPDEYSNVLAARIRKAVNP